MTSALSSPEAGADGPSRVGLATPPDRRSIATTTTLPPRTPPSDETLPRPERRPLGEVLGATALAVLVLSVAYWAVGPSGTDLSAQTERTQFAISHGLTPIDFSWYGGTNQFGYSLVSQFVMALFGVRQTGLLCGIVTCFALAVVFQRSGSRRPVWASVVAAAWVYVNLISGRITYAEGLTFGCLALAALCWSRRRRFTAAAVVLSFLAAITSPVAGLFVGMIAAALVLTDWTGSRTDRRGWWIGVAALAGIVLVSVPFGAGGYMNMSRADMYYGLGTSLAVALLVHQRVVRTVAFISGFVVVGAYLIHTPIGLNSLRLPMTFAMPVIIGYARRSPWFYILPFALVASLVQTAEVKDLRHLGSQTAGPAYFEPLLQELGRQQPTGRLEIPPLADYWESAYVAPRVPLARGWLRQVDIDRNPIFLPGRELDFQTYHQWLIDNGVEYVALPDAQLSWVADREARLVRAAPSWLTPVWSNQHWQLFKLADSTGIVPGANVTSIDSTGVWMTVPAPGVYTVRVQYSTWLTVRGAACVRGDGRWTQMVATGAGSVRISSSLSPSRPGHC